MLTICCCLLLVCANFHVILAKEPNFVFILTDDQDLLLNGLKPMTKTLKLVADKGKFFNNAFANTPVCCPSRSTILTGKYQHNTGVKNNSLTGNCSSYEWQKNHEPYSIAAYLKKHKNYVNFYAGKYLNEYGSVGAGGTKHVPFGYDWWIGLKGNSRYYNYTLSMNGTGVHFKNQYFTDVINDYAIKFLNINALGNSPFFMILAPPAPHAPFTPASRHSFKFPQEKVVRNKAFNATPTNKHWLVRMKPTHLPENVKVLDDIQRHRLQTLLAVDEMIENVIQKLESFGILDNTYIIFTSDHGFHIGQFTQAWDKRQPYQSDIRVPFFISGPSVSKKSITDYPISHVDILPTILDLLNLPIPDNIDGNSFKKELLQKKDTSFRKTILIEYSGEGNEHTVDNLCGYSVEEEKNLSECSPENWCKCQDSKNNTYTCIMNISSTAEFKFCRFFDKENFIEAYDLKTDSYELKNIFSELHESQLEGYNTKLDAFANCKGDYCY